MIKNIAIGLLLVVILGGGYFALKPKPIPSATPIVSSPAATQTPAAATVATPATAPKAAPGNSSKGCGTNMDCFITQVATCGPSTVQFSTALYGHTLTANYSVNKTSGSNCSFTDSAYGTTQVCSVPASDLAAVLKRWKAGNFDSGDLSNYACTTTVSDGTSFTTSPTSGGAAVSTKGYTYSYTDQVGGSLSIAPFSYKVLAADSASMTLSFTNNQTNQTGTVTAQLNMPAVFAGYTITFKGITQDGASFTIKE